MLSGSSLQSIRYLTRFCVTMTRNSDEETFFSILLLKQKRYRSFHRVQKTSIKNFKMAYLFTLSYKRRRLRNLFLLDDGVEIFCNRRCYQLRINFNLPSTSFRQAFRVDPSIVEEVERHIGQLNEYFDCLFQFL